MVAWSLEMFLFARTVPRGSKSLRNSIAVEPKTYLVEAVNSTTRFDVVEISLSKDG